MNPRYLELKKHTAYTGPNRYDYSKGILAIVDIGDLEDIHPRNKQDVGKRLAAWALNKDYGMKNMAFSGPLYHSYTLAKNKIIVHFDFTDNGLETTGNEVNDFEVMEKDGQWIEVKAKISGGDIELMLDGVSSPMGIRYAFRNNSIPNLFNKEGLPASCFEVVFE